MIAHEANQINKRHNDTKKLFIYATAERLTNQSLYDQSIEAEYDPSLHMLPIDIFNSLSDSDTPQILPDGSKALLPTTMAETIGHEMQHSVDDLNRQFHPAAAKFPDNDACIELRAVRREAKISKELFPGEGFRYAYTDTPLALEEIKHNSAKLADMSANGMHGLIQYVKESIMLSVGCNKEAWNHLQNDAVANAEALRMIKEAGIKMPASENGPKRSH